MKKKLLALLLAALMVVSLLPTVAFAGEVTDCTYTQKVNAPVSEETYQLKLGGKDKGEFTFEANGTGWNIKNSEGKYLNAENGKLVLGDTAVTAWTYKNGAFSTTEKTTQKSDGYWFLFWYVPGRGSKTVTTTYYLNTVTDGQKLSTNTVRAELYTTVSGAHDYEYVSKGNGTHDKVCRNCNDTVNEPCVYDEMTHKCVCGAYDPAESSVKISVVDVKEKTTKQFSGFLFWGTWKNVTTYTATIKTEAKGVRVTKVQYQLNGGSKWITGSNVSSNKPIETLKVKAWDNKGNLYEYEWPEETDKTSYNVTAQVQGDHGTATAKADSVDVTEATAGTSVVFEATADEGYAFDYWEVVSGGIDIEADKTDNPLTVTMPETALTVKAHFAKAYAVVVEANGHGTASADKTIGVSGDEVNLTITPDEGYEVDQINVIRGGVSVEENKFTIGTADVKIQVTFKEIAPDSYGIILEDDDHGTAKAQVNGVDVTSAAPEATVTLTATPNDGYAFKEWEIARGLEAGAITDNSFTMPANEVKVKAIFERVYNINLQTNEHGTASATVGEKTATTAAANAEVTLTATPDEGYQLKEWKVVSGGVTVTDNKFTMPAANVTVQAVFEEIPETKTVSEILATVDGDFPTAEETAWKNKGGERFSFKSATNLIFRNGVMMTNREINLTSPVEKNTENNYVHTGSNYTITFVMSDDKLSAITFTTEDQTLDRYNGTYAAPAAKTLKAVYDTTGDANTLTIFYDNIDHSGENKTVYSNLYTAPTATEVPRVMTLEETGVGDDDDDDSSSEEIKAWIAYRDALSGAWAYDGVRKDVKSVTIDESVKDYTGLTSTAFMFYNMVNAKSITGAEYLNVSKVTNMRSMFERFGEKATSMNSVPNTADWNTGNVTLMNDMFRYYGYDSTELNCVPNTAKWNTENVTNMNHMFTSYGNSSKKMSVVPDVKGWNTAKVTDMGSIFCNYGYSSTVLNAVPDVSKWVTSSVKDMSYMFMSYADFSASINEVPAVSKWNTSKAEDISSMFQGYGTMSEVLDKVPDVSGWVTSSVKDMSFMFNAYAFNSASINEVPDVSGWNTSKAENISYMFGSYGYMSKELVKVPDVSKWDTSNVEDMSFVFDCYATAFAPINEVPAVSGWKTSKAKKISGMFRSYGSTSFVLDEVPDVSKWDTSNVKDMSYVFDGYAMVSASINAVPDVSNWVTTNAENISGMFSSYGQGSQNLNCVPAVDNWDTSKVTDMSAMFADYGRSSSVLAEVPNVNGFKTSKVESFSLLDSSGNYTGLFEAYGASSNVLNFTLDLSNWDLSSLKTYQNTFKNAASLTENWNVTIPTTTSLTGGGTIDNYKQCWNLPDGKSYITPAEGKEFTCEGGPTFKAVYDTTGDENTLTFYFDKDTHSADGETIVLYDDLPNKAVNYWDWGYSENAENVKSVVIDESVKNYHGLISTSSMFYDMMHAESITGLDNLDVSSVTDMSCMFSNYGYYSTVLEDVPDVSGWNTENVTNMNSMFREYGNSSTALEDVPDVSGWNTENVTDMSAMFYYYGNDSTALVFRLDLSKWSLKSLESAGSMFFSAGYYAPLWKVIIPAKTGETDNDDTHWYIGDGTDEESYIEPDEERKFSFPGAKSFKAVYNTEGEAYVLTFYYDEKDVEYLGDDSMLFDNISVDEAGYWDYAVIAYEVKSVVIDESVKDYTGLTSTAYMFSDMSSAESITGLANLDVSNVTDMSYMFNGFGSECDELTYVPDVSGWNTENVTDMSYMFNAYGYSSTALAAVPDVSNWNTENVTNMEGMFYNYGCCSEVLGFELDLSNWSLDSLENAVDMFCDAGCSTEIWSVKIPAKTGTYDNSETAWYLKDGTFISPCGDKQFTVVSEE